VPTQATLSVVIVTYRSSSVIVPCLHSLEEFNDIGDCLEVTVIDSSPEGDVTYELVRRQFPWVRAARNPENGGYGQGNNVGARLSTGKYLLFLNPDTELVEPLFRFAVSAFESDSRLAVFGVQQLTASRRRCPSVFLRVQHQTKYPHGVPRLISWTGYFNAITMACLGAAVFIRTDVFRRVGCFDEELFLGCEESDLWNRVDLLGDGWHGGFFREKRLIHLGGSSQGVRVLEPSAFPQSDYRSVRHFYDKYGLDFRGFLRFERDRVLLRAWYWRLRGRKYLCHQAQLRVVELDQMLRLEK